MAHRNCWCAIRHAIAFLHREQNIPCTQEAQGSHSKGRIVHSHPLWDSTLLLAVTNQKVGRDYPSGYNIGSNFSSETEKSKN